MDGGGKGGICRLTVPRCIPVVFCVRIADVHLLEAIVRLQRRVGYLHEVFLAVLREPACSVCGEYLGGLGRLDRSRMLVDMFCFA